MLLNVVSSQKRASWWSQSSFINELGKNKTLEAQQVAKKEPAKSEKKHTFFPGSEANRDRIKGYSRIMIDTDSKLKFLWDSIIALSALGLGFIIPFSISFFSDINKHIWIYFSCIFCIDILVCFNTSYYSEGILITQRKKITKDYLKIVFR